MKRKLFFVVCLMVMSIQSVKAQNAKIILHHQGAASFFTSNQTQAAFNAAVDGDTIYFNDGSFTGNVTITKKVTLIGAGALTSKPYTKISGNVTISIGDGDAMLSSRLMEGIYVEGNVIIGKAVTGLTIRRCFFQYMMFNAAINECNIEQCTCNYSDGFQLSSNVKGLNVSNCRLWGITGAAPSAENAIFSNCNIKYMQTNCLATYRNCIISGSPSSYNNTMIYINCLCSSSSYMSWSNNNCWNYGKEILKDNGYLCVLSDKELTDAGYIGTDGKVVGYNGGETPWTLETTAPKITEYSSEVDPQTKKVTVNLKVANQ